MEQPVENSPLVITLGCIVVGAIILYRGFTMFHNKTETQPNQSNKNTTKKQGNDSLTEASSNNPVSLGETVSTTSASTEDVSADCRC